MPARTCKSTTSRRSRCNPCNEITFNGAFDDVNIDTTERSKLVTDFKKIMSKFKVGDARNEGVQEIQQTLDDLQTLKDIVYCYVRFACQQSTSTSNFNAVCLTSILLLSSLLNCVWINLNVSLQTHRLSHLLTEVGENHES